MQFFYHLENKDNDFVRRPLAWWACNEKKTLSTRWDKRSGVDSLCSTLKVGQWSRETKLKWARQITSAFSSVDSSFSDLVRGLQVEIDEKGNCILNTAGCLYVENTRYSKGQAVIFEHEEVVWAFSHNFSTKWRQEFLPQYWLGTRLYEILTGGSRPYTTEMATVLRFLLSGGTSEPPRYTEPSGLSLGVAEVLRKMLSFDDNERYETLLDALTAMTSALAEEHAKILVSELRAA